MIASTSIIELYLHNISVSNYSCSKHTQSSTSIKYISLHGQPESYKPFISIRSNLKIHTGDFPGGTVVKNPPVDAGDTGSIPSPGRSHMPWSN